MLTHFWRFHLRRGCRGVVVVILAALVCGRYTLDGQEIRRYVYDTAGQLIGVITPDGTTIIYTFDAAGNRTSLTVTVSTGDSITGLVPTRTSAGVTVSATITG